MPRSPTPPASNCGKNGVSPSMPEVTRRIAESRLRAKALRDAHDATLREGGTSSRSGTRSGIIATDQMHAPHTRKRAREALSSEVRDVPATNRDGRANDASPDKMSAAVGRQDGAILPARKFAKFVDYDFDKITDTKGGFLATEDDPWNKAMSGGLSANNKPGQPPEGPEQKPKGMSAAEWDRLQLLRRLRRQKAGPFEPGMSVLRDREEVERKKCRECGSLEVDFVWIEVFDCAVCNGCKEKMPDKYSLLTKTECRADYLLTDPELKDEGLLPHLSRPNPHKSHWHDMWLFLRYQVEEYAFGEKKWGSAEKLDEEFERREAEKKKKKEEKFKSKLADLKKRTRTEAWKRQHGKGGLGPATGKARFGDTVGSGDKHVHEWGRAVENEEGMTVKTCASCGMEVEELEF